MKLQFTELTLQNFKGFAQAQTLELSRPPGLHFVRGINRVEPRIGSNGSGKSTLFDALTWVLFGKTADGLRNTDIAPWRGKGQTVVNLELAIDDQPHTIQRTANPNAIALDGRPVGQDAIEQLTQLSFDVFINTVLLGQGRPLFLDLTPAGKIQLFIDVLDLEKWDHRSLLASKTVQLLEQDLAQATGELTGAESSLTQIEALLKQTTADSERWERERSGRIAQLDKERKAVNATLAKLEPKLSKAELAYDSAATELKWIRPKRIEQAATLNTLQRERDLQASQLQAATRRVDELEKQLAHMERTGECPLCGQALPDDIHKERLAADLDAARKEAKASAPRRGLAKEIGEAERTLAKYTADESGFQAKADAALTQVNLYQPDVASQREKLRQIDTAAQEWEDEANPHRDQLANLRARRKKLDATADQLRDEIDKTQARIERTRFWVKGFKDIRLFIVEQVLQELELATNAVLADLGLGDWQVGYAVEKETKAGTVTRGLTTTILSPANAQPARWEAWSGGEGQRLRLAGALALSEVLLQSSGVSVDTEILDEPTAHLSGEGVRDLCEALADRAADLDRRVWYVDHASVESARFASVTTVVKTLEGSLLE